jgi:hypothetical protein
MQNVSGTKNFSMVEILSRSGGVFSKHFITILLVILVTYLPVNILAVLAGGHFSDVATVKLAYYPVTILGSLWTTVGLMVVILIAYNGLTGQSEFNLVEGFKKAFSKWGSCIGTLIIAGLIVIGLIFCLIVPGIIWSIYYSFIIQIVMLKNVGGKEALGYSKKLVKTSGKVFIVMLLLRMFSIVPEYIITHFTSSLGSIAIIAGSLVYNLIGAFFTIAITVLFLQIDSMHTISSEQSNSASLN